MTFKKFHVVFLIPSGQWSYFYTDDRAEADAYAASESARTGWPHVVYVRA